MTDRTPTVQLLDATTDVLLDQVPAARAVFVLVVVPGDRPGEFTTVSAAQGNPALINKRTFWRAVGEVAVDGMREAAEPPAPPAARH